MTIQSSTVRVIYNGNNSTVVYYPVTFVYAVSTEVRVLVTDANSVNTELTFGTDYTVDPSGVLTTAAWDDTHTVTVYRVTDTVQLTDYVENDKFPADTHEEALDKLTRICQEIRETLTRTLQVSVNAPLSGPVPAATTRFLFIDDAGQFAAITPVEALAELDEAAGIGANYTAIFADAAARAAATPLFIGQIGVQLDTTGLNGFYRGTALSAGGWAQVFLGPADIQGLTSARLLGRYSSGSGNSEQIEIGTGLNLVAGVLNATASAPAVTQITGATQDNIVGRLSSGTGNAENIPLGLGLAFISGALKAGGLVKVTVVSASNPTFAFNAETNHALIILQAAGGGAAGSHGTSSTTASSSVAGAGGGWALLYEAVHLLTNRTCALTVGAAGAGGTAGNSGSAGGNTTYINGDSTQTVVAQGGRGGVFVTANSSYQIKGVQASPSQGTGGLANVAENFPTHSYSSGDTGISGTYHVAVGEKGGDSLLGRGGGQTYVTSVSSTSIAGFSGKAWGGGGGGAVSIKGAAGATGGSGAVGAAIVIEFK